MKKILGLLLVVSASIAFGAAATGTVTNIECSKAVTIAAGVFDTVAGADSSTLISLYTPTPGYEYILDRGAITGGGSDSVKLALVVDAYDVSGNFLHRTAVDTFTASAGEHVLLPFWSTIYGTKFTIKAVAIADNGGEVILNKLSIWQRRAITYTKGLIF